MIPATIVGLNGLLFQFCAITGLWDAWAVMWTIEPLSVGLPLLLIGARKRLPGLLSAGLVLCGVAGVGLAGMTAILSMNWILSGWWRMFKLVGSAILILVGALLLFWGLTHRSLSFKVTSK